MIFMREVNMKNNRPGILQFDWSIASRHGRIYVMVVPYISLHFRVEGRLLIIQAVNQHCVVFNSESHYLLMDHVWAISTCNINWWRQESLEIKGRLKQLLASGSNTKYHFIGSDNFTILSNFKEWQIIIFWS